MATYPRFNRTAEIASIHAATASEQSKYGVITKDRYVQDSIARSLVSIAVNALFEGFIKEWGIRNEQDAAKREENAQPAAR